MKICECCGKKFDEKTLGKYSTGRFCSKSCANTRKHSEETKEKIRVQTKSRLKSLGFSRINGSFIIKRPKRLYRWVWFKCKYCGAFMLEYTNKLEPEHKFCSKSCFHLYLSELASKQVNKGYGAYGRYKGFRCDSLLELCFLIFCLDHNIPIQRCHDSFKYSIDNKIHRYTPDFVINSRYIEIKGWTSATVEIKAQAVKQAGHAIYVLYEKDIKKCISYVCSKYNLKRSELKCLYENQGYTKTCSVCGKVFLTKDQKKTVCSQRCDMKRRIWISNGFDLKHIMPEELSKFNFNDWYQVKPAGVRRGWVPVK